IRDGCRRLEPARELGAPNHRAGRPGWLAGAGGSGVTGRAGDCDRDPAVVATGDWPGGGDHSAADRTAGVCDRATGWAVVAGSDPAGAVPGAAAGEPGRIGAGAG